MFPLTRSTGSKKQSRLAAHAPFSCRLTARTSIPSNNSSQGSNRSYAKSRRALLRSFGEQSPLFSKGFPKKNAKLISQTQATPNLIEKCSRRRGTYALPYWRAGRLRAGWPLIGPRTYRLLLMANHTRDRGIDQNDRFRASRRGIELGHICF